MITPLMKSIKRGNFSQPTMFKKTSDKCHSLNEVTKNDSYSISTRDSEDYEVVTFDTNIPQNLQFNSPSRAANSAKFNQSCDVQGPKLNQEQMKIMNERIAAGDKKVKTIIH
jgi:hypothetical protein